MTNKELVVEIEKIRKLWKKQVERNRSKRFWSQWVRHWIEGGNMWSKLNTKQQKMVDKLIVQIELYSEVKED